jgi:Endonuclease/Exonuclease/phosphatase family
MKIVVHRILVTLSITLLWLGQSAYAGNLEVMTQNQYFGADLAPLLSAPDSEFNAALVNVLHQMAATNAPARIKAQAELITARNPDVVGLQEVTLVGCSDPYETGACTDPSIKGAFVDHLALTLSALNGAYKVAASVINFNVPILPFYLDGIPAVLTFVDRDVILVRTDLAASVVNFGSACVYPEADGCNYVAALGPISTPYGNVYFERGYVGVDVTVAGKDYRVVNTHLEVKDPPIPSIYQNAQAQELIATLAATTPSDKSLVITGDINSSPADVHDQNNNPPYWQFLESGYTDVWTLRPGKDPGFSCCQLGDLSNHKSILYERDDMIFSLDALAGAKQPRVLGDVVSSKTSPPGRGLWPSDHGAVAATLVFD